MVLRPASSAGLAVQQRERQRAAGSSRRRAVAGGDLSPCRHSAGTLPRLATSTACERPWCCAQHRLLPWRFSRGEEAAAGGGRQQAAGGSRRRPEPLPELCRHPAKTGHLRSCERPWCCAQHRLLPWRFSRALEALSGRRWGSGLRPRRHSAGTLPRLATSACWSGPVNARSCMWGCVWWGWAVDEFDDLEKMKPPHAASDHGVAP